MNDPRSETRWPRARARWHQLLQKLRRDVPGAGLLALLVRELRRDELAERAAALAFITVVSLVPLMATVSLVAGPITGEESTLFLMLQWLLPYSEDNVLAKLREFVDQARAIRGIGLVAFLVTALAAFFTVDHTINRIWKIGQRRPFPARLRSFSLILFWTPAMVAVTSSSLYVLHQRATSPAFVDQILALMPLTVTILGLSMLYWLVPFTSVGFRHAAIGAGIAAVLLELLRNGFSVYIQIYQVTRVYGGFGLVVLFLISIQLGWLVVLLGCEIAYCLQNRQRLLRQTASAHSSDAGWVGLAAMLVVFEQLCHGKPIVSRPLVANRLHLDVATVEPVLEPLVDTGLIVPSSDGAGYLLAADPYTVPVEAIFAVYDRVTDTALSGLAKPLRGRLEHLRSRLTTTRCAQLQGLTLAEAAAESRPVAKSGSVAYNAAPRVGQ